MTCVFLTFLKNKVSIGWVSERNTQQQQEEHYYKDKEWVPYGRGKG